MSVAICSALSPRPQNRLLVPCVLVSLVLHALALLLPAMHPGAAAPAAAHILTATFMPRETTPAAPLAPPEVKKRIEPEPTPPRLKLPIPQPESERPKLEAMRPRPEARLVAPSETSSAPAPAAPSAQPAAFTAVPSADAAGAASTPAAIGPDQRSLPGASPGAGRAESAPDAGTLDQFRLALIGAARRYKRYPAQAMDRGWQGRVEIRLVVGANGMIRSSVVKTSSGYEVLDSQALDMVRKAKPLTPIPAALRGREFSVDIPVIFDLQAG